MGRRRRKHKHKKKHQQQQQQQASCDNKSCDEQQQQTDEAECVEIESQEQLKELLDIIMDAGMARVEIYEEKQKQLNNALLEDVGLPIPPEEPKQTENAVTVLTDDDSAI